MSFRRLLLAGALLSALAAGGWLARGAGRGASDTVASRLAGARTTATPAGTARLAGIVERLRRETAPAVPPGALPASLRGTEVDGALPVDANGNLVVGPAVRRFFDYFLSAAGEESEAALQTRLGAEIRARLDGAAAAQALDLLDRYMEYRARARDLGAERVADLDARLERVKQLRAEVFGADDARALFGDVEARDEVATAQRRVLSDPATSEDEKARQLVELEMQLPEDVRRARAASLAPLHLYREEARLRARGAPPEEIRAARQEAFGTEAADRLEELDRQRADWQQRVDDYRRERAAIESDASLNEAERSAAVAALLARRFSEPERLRLQALDSLQEQSGNK